MKENFIIWSYERKKYFLIVLLLLFSRLCLTKTYKTTKTGLRKCLSKQKL